MSLANDIGCKLKQNANEGCIGCATVVQVLYRTCFMFYCMFYFTCDRSFSASVDATIVSTLLQTLCRAILYINNNTITQLNSLFTGSKHKANVHLSLYSFKRYLTGWPKKTKLSYFGHIFAKYLPIFTIFSPVDSVRNLLLIGMPTTPTMSLHYLVKHKYSKNQQNHTAEGLMVK